MFLRCKIRKKNGKEHRSWSLVENQRLADGRVVQRHVLYLGEINDSQNLAWRKSIEAFLEDQPDQPPTSDCVQVVIGLIVTPEGFPLAYEVFSGNTSDRTTLQDFLARIEKQYGQAQRIWIMDRGIPTEETLEQMRAQDPPVQYLVGTPRGRLNQYEQSLLAQPWQTVRAGVAVKLRVQDQELYVLAQSQDRVAKERSMRRRQLKWLWRRLKEIQAMELSRDQLMKKLGVAQHEAPSAWRLVTVTVAATQKKQPASFNFQLCQDKLRITRRREGRYLLRSNLTATDPAKLWSFYLQLTQVEEAFKNLKGDLAIRPIYLLKCLP